jgi:UDP-N-acetyl-D-mannosaminuronate dehydrogenase
MMRLCAAISDSATATTAHYYSRTAITTHTAAADFTATATAVCHRYQVIALNDFQKQRFTRNMLQRMFNTVTGKRIALFGFAFKKDTGDTRESPAVFVAKALLEEGAKLRVYDPQVILLFHPSCSIV